MAYYTTRWLMVNGNTKFSLWGFAFNFNYNDTVILEWLSSSIMCPCEVGEFKNNSSPGEGITVLFLSIAIYVYTHTHTHTYIPTSHNHICGLAVHV